MEDPSALPFPYEFRHVTPEEKQAYDEAFPTSFTSIVRVGPKGFIMNTPYQKDAANIYNMPLRSTDIFVASYQRSGTTWTQELVWLIAKDLDYDTAAKVTLNERYPFLECFSFFDVEQIDDYIDMVVTRDSVDPGHIREYIDMMVQPASALLASTPSPRFVKTHLPMSLLPPYILSTAKVVYVARDPRDVAVSSYYHGKLFMILGENIDFKQFWKLFDRDLLILTPYFEHVKEAWEKRHEPNMLFLFYEDMLKDLPTAIRRVAKFLGKEINIVQMDVLCDHLNIANFKNNKSVNSDDLKNIGVMSQDGKFIRQGKSGGWRDYFDEEMTQQAAQWIRENLRDTDLRFPTINIEKL